MDHAKAHQPLEFRETAAQSAQLRDAPALRAPNQPPPFRAKYKTELRDPHALPTTEEPPQPRKRSRGYSIWHNRDFRVMIAVLLTAALAAYVYHSMKVV